jgi:hypothetical protein
MQHSSSPPQKNRRSAFRALAQAFDNAAYSVAVAPEVNAHYGEPEPTRLASWTTWCRGFFGGLAGDFDNKPVTERICGLVGIGKRESLATQPADRDR